MPLRIGLLAYPLMIFALQMGRPSATAAFERAGAVTPETSRRPSTLEVPMRATRRAIRKKLLVPVGDGRFYLDERAVRRADRRTMILMIIATAAFVPIVWLIW
jgi:hypothetical protein